MNKIRGLLNHLTVIFGMVFLTFLVLDQFNPMMNFVSNAVSRWLLAVFCLSGICRTVLCWNESKR